MKIMNSKALIVIGVSIFLGLFSLGYLLNKAAIEYKAFERVVTVKGLSEREYPADNVIWPIQFSVAGNDLQKLVAEIDAQSVLIKNFLQESGLTEELQSSSPAVVDKKAQQYGGNSQIELRYIATQTLTLSSNNIDVVRKAIAEIGDLAKKGIVFNQNGYANQIIYSFSSLNAVKPEMIEEATKNAREVAEKFAQDSQSELGKIRTASQGQFSISDRDRNTPHIKKIRVVSTVQYYLSD